MTITLWLSQEGFWAYTPWQQGRPQASGMVPREALACQTVEELVAVLHRAVPQYRDCAVRVED